MILKHALLLAGAVVLVVWILFFSVNQVQQCERGGGTLREGAVWVDCIEAGK